MAQESQMLTLVSYNTLVHAISGAAGSAVAITVFYPLDTARTRLQIDDQREAKSTPVILQEIAEEEGFLSLYRGLLPVVTSLCCSNFVYFYTFNGLKSLLKTASRRPSVLRDLLFGSVAGIVNVLMTTPLWVVNTRLKLQGIKFKTKEYKEHKYPRYAGILDGLRRIAADEGVRSLWSGMLPSLCLVVNPAVQFMVYEALKRYFFRIFRTKELSALTYFFIGAIAKMVATVLTYPLQIVQSRLRAGYIKMEEGMTGIINSLKDLLRKQGVSGLYKGLEAKLFQTVLTAALMFLTYEKIAASIFRLMGQARST